MDVSIKKIEVKPVRFNKEGEMVDEEHALITIKMPLVSQPQKQALIKLLDHLSVEEVTATIEEKQLKIPNFSTPQENKKT